MQSEIEYLSKYNIADYERPSVAADIVAFMIRTEEGGSYRQDPKSRLSILLIQRGRALGALHIADRENVLVLSFI